MIVYKTVNIVNGKIYVGQDSKNDPTYFGSGIHIRNAIRKYGKENFIKITLCECSTKEDLDDKEIYWISLLNSTNKLVGYNISRGGDRFRECDGETKDKIRKTLTGRKLSEETKTKIGAAHRGKKKPKSFCESMSKIHKGKFVSPETREKIRAWHLGKKLSSETKEKMRKSRIGDKNPFFGKKHSEETKEKIRQSRLKRNQI